MWLKFDTLDEAYNWGRWMMDLHGLQDWTLKFVKMRDHGDCCRIKKTIRIDIAHALQLRMAIVMDTILHEIAHALVDKKYERHHEAWDWVCTNSDKNVFEASEHFGIPVEELKALILHRRKPHDGEWARQAVAIGVCVHSELQSNRAALKRAMSDAGIKDFSKINQRKTRAALKAAEMRKKR